MRIIVFGVRIQMLFRRVVAGIASGAYGLFSASRNGHVARCGAPSETDVPSRSHAVGGRVVRLDCECTCEDYFMKTLKLDRWRHVTTLIHDAPDSVTVEDELTWPCCHATRRYTLRSAGPDDVRREDSEWRFERMTGLHGLIRHKMSAGLLRADREVFAQYVRSLRDAEGDDGDERGGGDAVSGSEGFFRSWSTHPAALD